VIQRAFRYRLYPTEKQAELMAATANARRFIYNLALEQRRDFHRQAAREGFRLNYISQGREVTQLRAECDWLAAIHGTPLTQALRDLDAAFSGFFRGHSAFPRFQSKERHMGFRHKAKEISVRAVSDRWSMIRIPKIGFVRLRHTRPLRGEPISATFSRDALGWHVSVLCKIEHEAAPSTLPAIGIDRGVVSTVTLSNGEMLSTPCVAVIERRKRKAQRVLARRTRGSKRYAKQRARVARLSAKMARTRGHWQHETSSNISRRFGFVALEDLNTKGMTRGGKGKRGLNRSILQQGWYGFETKLAYKLEERGGALTKINPAYTSQTCSACGTIDSASRESQARFACQSCGFTENADVNAAINILCRSTAVAEGSAYAPVEASIDQAIAA
jgi:putative transposase